MYQVCICSPSAEYVVQPLYFYRVHSGSAETLQNLTSQKKKLRSYLHILSILRGYYDSGRKDALTADKLMTFLHFSLYMITALPQKDADEALAQLKAEGFYPFRRPAECTLSRSYMISREGLIGKAFDKVYLNQHRPWGYFLMRTAQQARILLKKVRS